MTCRSLLTCLLGGFVFLFLSSVASGSTFGIYDARTLAMGGTSVASANNDNAQFYNAALLAFNAEFEEDTQDSRFLFPLLIPQVSESAITIEEISRDDPAAEISRAITAFNEMPDAVNAAVIVDATEQLQGYLADLDGEDMFADVYVGLAISEPGKFQGAGFFLGTRLIAGGQAIVSEDDRATLAAYQEGLEFVASDGARGVEHPELFDANGTLVDPRNDFGSTATASGAAITEAGVAMSQQTRLFGLPLAAGFSFKVQRIDTFEDVERIVDDRLDAQRNSERKFDINFDVGFAKDIGDRWRVGLAVKDIIPHNYATSLGTEIKFRPRARIGATYRTDHFRLAADADLTRIEPLGSELSTQELAIGGEWIVNYSLKVRAGYRHDIQGTRDDTLSFGVGTIWKRLAIDLAYAAGSSARAAALQFGYVF